MAAILEGYQISDAACTSGTAVVVNDPPAADWAVFARQTDSSALTGL
jgi:hypothetical protein